MTYSNVSCSVRPFRYCAIIKSFVHSSYFCYTIMKVTTDQRTSLEHTLRVFAMHNGLFFFYEVVFTIFYYRLFLIRVFCSFIRKPKYEYRFSFRFIHFKLRLFKSKRMKQNFGQNYVN